MELVNVNGIFWSSLAAIVINTAWAAWNWYLSCQAEQMWFAANESWDNAQAAYEHGVKLSNLDGCDVVCTVANATSEGLVETFEEAVRTGGSYAIIVTGGESKRGI